MSGIFLVLLLAALVVGALSVVVVTRSLLFVSEPNEALIFAGAKRMVGAKAVGYRFVRGGRGIRVPLLEQVHRFDLTMFTIDLQVQNAYSAGGIPLNVVGVANMKIAGDLPLIDNAIERFLGKPRPEIMRIAKETLEGNLRGVLAQLTPEEVNEDKVRFAQTLIEEAEHDMSRMGLVLDTLKVQNVSDDVGYLNSIGRIRGAVVRQQAAIAEAQAQSQASVQRAQNLMRSELAKVEADLEIARQENKKRVADAVSKREALIAEAEGQVKALIAQARAEIERQQARVLQVQRKLEAEVVQPAGADCRAAEEQARGAASRIIEQGRAQAGALKALVEELAKTGPSGREILVLQKLLPLASQVSGADQKLQASKVTFLAGGSGHEEDWSRKAVASAEQLRAATGIDLAAVAKRLSAAPPPSTPPKPTT